MQYHSLSSRYLSSAIARAMKTVIIIAMTFLFISCAATESESNSSGNTASNYLVNGYVLSRVENYDASNRLIQIAYYSYDTTNNVISIAIDLGANGTIDLQNSENYDENGLITQRRVDSDNDGLADDTISYEFNADGYITLSKIDRDSNSIIDSVESYVWQDTNQLIEHNIDEGVNGNIDSQTLFIWNNNQHFQTKYDSNNDGNLESVSYPIYSSGNIIDYKEQESFVGNNEVTIVDYSYDAAGNLVQETLQTTTGQVLGLTVYSYQTSPEKITNQWLAMLLYSP